MASLWRRFCDWVKGNGPRPENEVIPPEAPPDLPFARRPRERRSRFREQTIRERYGEWLDHHGLRLFSRLYASLGVIACLALTGLLLATVAELPPFGDPSNPANNEVVRRYVERGGAETGARNIVAGMILDYRAFDTFGESAVLFTALSSVLMLLGAAGERKRSEEPALRSRLLAGDRLLRGPPDPILRGVAALAIPAILMLGCAVIVNGHITPGGGFSGGAILSTALILADTVHAIDIHKINVMGLSSGALAVYAAAKGYSFFTGANHIASGIPTGTVGNLFSGGLILPLNVCVGLVVAVTLYGFYALFGGGEAGPC